MFNFGSPEDTARLFFDQAVRDMGPGLSDQHYEEMEEEELRNLFVYLRITYFTAARSGASDEVVEVIVQWYDEVFLYLLEALEDFRAAVCDRTHKPIIDLKKYYKLAGCTRSAN